MQAAFLPPVSIIVAVAAHHAIGAQGGIPFRISADMKRFRNLTMGKPIIMGRRTFESLPSGALPGRRNIVITRRDNYLAEGAEVVSSLDDALSLAATGKPDEIMIIGGGQIYGEAIDLTHRIYLTEVCREYPDADTFFPRLDFGQWIVEEASEPLVDTVSSLGYRFITLRRR